MQLLAWKQSMVESEQEIRMVLGLVGQAKRMMPRKESACAARRLPSATAVWF